MTMSFGDRIAGRHGMLVRRGAAVASDASARLHRDHGARQMHPGDASMAVACCFDGGVGC